MTESGQSQSRIPMAAPTVSQRAKDRVESVLDSGYLAAGETVRTFEEEFAKYCGAEHAIAVANGTAALHAALVACGIGDGDRVLTTPFSFVATANAIRFTGAEPVFADIDPETLNLAPDAVRERLANCSVDAILPVHLYGLPAAMNRLSAIADEHGAYLIEDAAQAHGATYRGEPVGSLGDIGTFSFYPTKNMTTGEGGMVVTDDASIANRARRFRNHGRDGTYEHVTVGHNFRLSNVAAAIGRTQLERLPSFVRARRENAARLTDSARSRSVTAPPKLTGRRHAYHQYTVRTDARETLVHSLEDKGIDNTVYYPTPIHEQPAYDEWDIDLPNAERAAQEVLSVPVHPQLSAEDVDRIADALASFDPS